MTRAILVWLLLVVPAWGADLFQWTAPAQHHASVVRVTSRTQSGTFAGSGVYARLSGDLTAVLTCAHVVRGSSTAEITWNDGSKNSGNVHTDKTGADSAVVLVTHPTIPPLPLAALPPVQGDQVEYLGFGGPSGVVLRPHRGNVLGFAGHDMRSTAPVVSGDSGGAILNARAEIVGLSAYGLPREGTKDVPFARVGEWSIWKPSGGPGLASLTDFAERVVTRVQCPPGGSCGPGAPPSQGGGGLYPPQTPYQKPPMVPVPPIAPQPIDLDELAGLLVEKLAADERFRGPPGIDGLPGIDGADGPAGRDGPEGPPGPPISEQQIREAVIAWAQSNPEELAGLVLPHLPPIHFRKIDAATGRELASPDAVRLGEGFEFRLHPR